MVKTRKVSFRHGLLIATAIPAIFACAPAQAQDQANDDGTSASQQGGVTEIVVTARKREESVQDVPVAVTAVSGETIQQQDLTSLEKLAAHTPNFTVGRASNGSGAQMTLRGIGSSSTSIGIEQSVAVVVDGVYYGQGRVIQEGFFDLERIELLKGPQALFFGKNATAGVISLTTADPGKDPEFKLRASYEFESQQAQLEGIASVPLGDSAGIRIAVRGTKSWDGYFHNGAVAQPYATFDIATSNLNAHTASPAAAEEPGEKELLGRVTLKVEPSDSFTATFKLSGDYSTFNNSSWNYMLWRCANGASSSHPLGTSSLNPAVACGQKFTVFQNNFPSGTYANFPYAKSNGALYNDYRSLAATANLNYDAGDVTVTSVTNYQWNRNRFGCACDFQSSASGTWATENSSWKAFSTELRALTSFAGPLNFLVGGLYQKTTRNFEQFIMFANIEDSTASAENRYLAFRKNSVTKGETLALFGQATFKITPELELAGGVRYTHETKDSSFTQPYVNAALTGIFLSGASSLVAANQTFNNWSPEATLTWKPSKDITVYGAYKTAYKSGGFSNGGIASAVSPDPVSDFVFAPERARGFEAGIKTKLADNQLRLNLIAYSYKYLDLQIDFFNSPIFAFQTLTADARTRGAELEFEFAPRSAAGLNVHGSVNYNDAKYSKFIGPCYSGQHPSEGCTLGPTGAPSATPLYQNLAGAPLAVAPKWTGTLGASYSAEVGGGMRFGVSADGRYSGDYLASGFGQPDSRVGSFVTLDGSIRLGSADDRWEVAVIGKNLTNKAYITGVVDGPSTGSGTGTAAGIHADQLGFSVLPRTVMVQLSTRF